MKDNEPLNGNGATSKVAPLQNHEFEDHLPIDTERNEVKIDDYILHCINRKVLDIRTTPYTDQIKHAGKVNDVKFSRCGQFLASASGDKFMKLWNIYENKEEWSLNYDDSVNTVSFSHDGKFLATGSDDRYLKIIDIKDKVVFEKKLQESKVLSVCFSPDGYYLAVGLKSGESIIYETSDMSIYCKLNLSNDSESSISKTSEVKEMFLKNNSEGILKLTSTDRNLSSAYSDKKDPEKTNSYSGALERGVNSIIFSFNNYLVATGSDDSTVRIFNLRDQTEVFIKRHSKPVLSVSFCPNNLYVASASKDKTVKIWEIESNQYKKSLDHSKAATSVSYSPIGNFLVTGSNNFEVKVWETFNYEVVFIVKHAAKVNTVCFSPDIGNIASGSYDNSVKLWNFNENQYNTVNIDEKNIKKYQNFYGIHKDTVRAVSFSNDGKLLVTGSDDCSVRVWDIYKSSQILIRYHKGPVYSVSFHPNQLKFASGSYDNKAMIWDINSELNKDKQILEKKKKKDLAVEEIDLNKKAEEQKVEEKFAEGDQDKDIKEKGITHSDTVQIVCFSNEGKLLASGSFSGEVKVNYTTQNMDSFHFYTHSGPVFSVTFSHDDEYIVSGSFDQTILICKLSMFSKEAFKIKNLFKVTSILLSEDSIYLAAGSYDKNNVTVWDFKNLISLDSESLKETDQIINIQNKNQVKELDSNKNQNLKIIEIPSEKVKSEVIIISHKDTVNSLAFSKKGSILASASTDGTIKVYNIKEKQELFTGFHLGPVNSVVFSKDGNFLASGSYDESVKIWNIEEKQEEFIFSHSDTVNSLSFSSEEDLLASVSNDKTVKVWKISQESKMQGRQHDHGVNVVSFSPNSKLLASGSDDFKVKIWEIDDENIEKRVFNHNGVIICIAFSNDSKLIASGCEDNNVRVWRVRDEVQILDGKHNDTVTSVSFSNDGNFLASSSYDKTVRIWNLKNQEPDSCIIQYTGRVNVVSFSPDSKLLASVSHDQKVRVWDIEGVWKEFYEMYLNSRKNEEKKKTENYKKQQMYAQKGNKDIYFKSHDNIQKENKKLYKTGKIIQLRKYLRGSHSGSISTMCFSYDGKFLASGSYDNSIKVWNVEYKNEEFTGYHTDTVNSVSFSPDNNFVASGSEDKKVKVWNIKQKREEFIGKHSGSIMTVFFSPDGNFLASGSYDNYLKVWNIIEKREEFRFEHKDTVRSVCFSPDGSFLASGSDDNQVTLCEIKIKHKEMQGAKIDVKKRYSFGSQDEEISDQQKNNRVVKESLPLIRLSSDLRFAACKYQIEDNEVIVTEISTNKYLGVFDKCPQLLNLSLDGKSEVLYKFSLEKSEKSEFIGKFFQEFYYNISITDTYAIRKSECIIFNESNSIYCWDTKTDMKSEIFKDNKTITSMCISADNLYLAFGSIDGSTNLIEIGNHQKEIRNFEKHQVSVTCICFSYDGIFIVSGYKDGLVKIFNINIGTCINLEHNSKDATSVSISHDNNYLAIGFSENSYNIWSFSRNHYIIKGSTDCPVLCVQFSNFQSKLAIAKNNGEIMFWEFASSNKIMLSELKDSSMLALYNDESKAAYNYLKVDCDNNQRIYQDPKIYFKMFKICSIGKLNDGERNNECISVMQSDYGFEILDRTNSKVRSLQLLKIDKFDIWIKIDKNIHKLKLKKPLVLNELILDLLEYQAIKKCTVCIDTDILPSNILLFRPHSIADSFCYGEVILNCILDKISKNSFIKAQTKYCDLPISEYKYTLIHFASFLGESKALKKLLIDSEEKFNLKADIFGKSPLYYSIMKKHLISSDVILEFLINIDPEDNFRLVSSLHSTRNDFLLIIQTSSTKLPDYLSKLLMEDIGHSKFPASIKLPCKILSETIKPSFKEFDQKIIKTKEDKQITCILKYTALPIPIKPFSSRNIEALKVTLYCTNKKIYDNTLIQYFIDENWNSVVKWVLAYSILVWIHFIFYCITLAYPENLLTFIPFWGTYFLIFVWEVLQITSDFTFYKHNPWNIIDLLIICWTPVWSILRIYSIEFLYSDLFLAMLLMVRGIAAFKIFDGTRDYVHLILQSLKNMSNFLIIFIYTALCFSIFLFIVLVNDHHANLSYYDLIRMSWAICIGGDNGVESDSKIIFLIIFISTILNLILMLNMLISILGDSYDQFCLEKNSIDYREKIHLTLEIQNALFWKNRMNKSFFFHILSNQFENDAGNEDDWQGRIMFSEQRQEKRIESLGVEISEITRIQKKIEGSQKKYDTSIIGIEKQLKEININIEKILGKK